MSDIKVIEGGIFTDHRGKLSHVNNLDMSEVERFYIIQHDNTEVIRAWHAHQYEKKWFYCIKGSFTGAFVKIDNWENPSNNLIPEIFELTEKKSEVICIPEGYANGFKANEPDSILLVFSNKTLDVAVHDSWRYDASLWMKW